MLLIYLETISLSLLTLHSQKLHRTHAYVQLSEMEQQVKLSFGTVLKEWNTRACFYKNISR